MAKYTLLIDQEPYSLDILLDKKEISRSEKTIGYTGEVVIPTHLNYLNLSLYIHYLNTSPDAKLKKLAPLLKEVFQFCSATAPVSALHRHTSTISLSDLETAIFSEPSLTKNMNKFFSTAKVTSTGLSSRGEFLNSKQNKHRQIYEHMEIRYLEPDFLSKELEMRLEPVSSDLKTVSASRVKRHEKLLLSYINNKVKEKIETLVSQLGAHTASEQQFVYNINGANLQSYSNYKLTLSEVELHDSLLGFVKDLQPYVDKILQAAPIHKIKNLSSAEFKGAFSKTNDVDKNKSYMYIVSNNQGLTGFLGLALTPYKASREYSAQYSLAPVQSISGALIFHTQNHKECGIGELRNKNLYTAVEAVECSQIFRMKDTVFEDNKIQAFASALQKAHLEEYMTNLPLPQAQPPENAQIPPKKRHKI